MNLEFERYVNFEFYKQHKYQQTFLKSLRDMKILNSTKHQLTAARRSIV